MPPATVTHWQRAMVIVFGFSMAVLFIEGALRVVYRDAGERTLGGPGGKSFVHETIDGERRGRLDVGPKTPGVPRVMIVGDSITYGLGVREWTDTWPELLARQLQAAEHPHEFAVFAVPGNDMPQHLETVRGSIRRVQPDIFIYQWYVNDIEAISHRQSTNAFWQRFPFHESLRAWSYAYFELDHHLDRSVNHPGETYISYLTKEFVPGTLEWTEFEREFHEFGMLAQTAQRRILLLYPQVPFRGQYPLKPLHDRMSELVRAHTLQIPPGAWMRSGGALVDDPDSPWGQAVHWTPEGGALQVETRDYLFEPGDLELHLAISAPEQEVGVLSLIDPAHDAMLVSAPLQGTRALSDVVVRFTLTGDRLRRLAIRLTTPASGQWKVANIAFPVNYDFEVIDLTTPMNTFPTHASRFDGHPNERAHQLMAATVYDALQNVH